MPEKGFLPAIILFIISWRILASRSASDSLELLVVFVLFVELKRREAVVVMDVIAEEEARARAVVAKEN